MVHVVGFVGQARTTPWENWATLLIDSNSFQVARSRNPTVDTDLAQYPNSLMGNAP